MSQAIIHYKTLTMMFGWSNVNNCVIQGDSHNESYKKYLKFIIGIAVLLVVIVAFMLVMQTSDLENGDLKKWRAADLDARMAAAQILSASDENLELLVQCVDKMASLPDSGEMAVRDAMSLCYTGIQLKANN